MRWSLVFLGLVMACGTAAEQPQSPSPRTEPVAPVEELPRETIFATARILLEVPLALVQRDGVTGLRFRVTNRSDAPLLADLRSADRVVGTRPPRVHMPLSDAQRSELSLISSLTSIAPGATVEYAVPLASFDPSCEGERRVALAGVLIVIDGDRTSELVADGASVAIPCDRRVDALQAGTIWVAEDAPITAESRALSSFAEGMAPLVRGASIDPGAPIALLAFSYDPRPIERFRYDACVELGRCPARAIPQPPGSLHAPAVGMTWEAADAFCVSRGLRVASEAERNAIADPSRELVSGDARTTVLAGFSCARAEPG